MQQPSIQKVLPDPAMREYISQFTFIDIPYAQTQKMEFTVLPSSHTRMILTFGIPSLHEVGGTFQRIDNYSMTGLLSRPHIFYPTASISQIMIHFTAWGAQANLDFPLDEITDSRVDLHHIYKYDFEKLCADLDQCKQIISRTRILNQFFINRLSKIRPIDQRSKNLIQHICSTHGTLRLPELADQLWIGQRTAQRIVHNTTGVNFKFFSRLIRLEHVKSLMTQKDISLTDVAFRAGYFDQAHFIHDFQEGFHESPGSYLSRQQQMVWNLIDPNAEQAS